MIHGLQGFGELLAADADGHFGQPHVGRPAVESSCVVDGFQGGRDLSQVSLSACAQHVHLELKSVGQASRLQGGVGEHVQLLALGNHRPAQSLHHLGPVDAQPQSLIERNFGRHHIAVFQQGLAQQQLHRQVVRGVFQRVLELDDGAGVVLFLETLQRVFVKA
ncbi:hypothetical protein D9M68_891250 [compost metagenome]